MVYQSNDTCSSVISMDRQHIASLLFSILSQPCSGRATAESAAAEHFVRRGPLSFGFTSSLCVSCCCCLIYYPPVSEEEEEELVPTMSRDSLPKWRQLVVTLSLRGTSCGFPSNQKRCRGQSVDADKVCRVFYLCSLPCTKINPCTLYLTLYQPLYLKYPPLNADADRVCVKYPPLNLTPSLHSYYHFKLLCLCSVPSNVTQWKLQELLKHRNTTCMFSFLPQEPCNFQPILKLVKCSKLKGVFARVPSVAVKQASDRLQFLITSLSKFFSLFS